MSQLNRNGSLGMILTRELIIFAYITSMTSIRVAKQVGSNNTTVHKTPKLSVPLRLCSREEVANKAEQPVPQKLGNVTSMNIVHCNFVAGNMKQKKNTNDHIILSIIQYGLKINFTEKPQYQNVSKIPHGMLETEIITQEVKKLLNKGVI